MVSAEKELGQVNLKPRNDLIKMTPEEKAEHYRKVKKIASQRHGRQHNGLAKDGITTPSHIQHDEPLSRYLADKMVRQEAGISTRPGFSIIGDGCFRARAYPKHS